MSSLTASLGNTDLNQLSGVSDGQYATVTHYRRVYPHNLISQKITVNSQTRRPQPARSDVGCVGGKERVKFYRRPLVPGNQRLVPVIKYAPDVSRAGDDFTAEFLARRDSLEEVRRSVSQVATVSVQTLYRETETQTEPYTPASPQPPGDLQALASLGHGHGLPVQTDFDVERVRRLVRLQQEELQLEELDTEERKERRDQILSERQELDWEGRERAATEMKNHREAALDGYIKVGGEGAGYK